MVILEKGKRDQLFGDKIVALACKEMQLILLSDRSVTIKYRSYEELHRKPQMEILSRIPSYQKAFNLLKFQAMSDFHASLNSTYHYYNRLLSQGEPL